ncbi:MAG: hypothetical protein SPL59_01905 [Catonella sp.]|nr:hypothetical protein [Catonella sp.]
MEANEVKEKKDHQHSHLYGILFAILVLTASGMLWYRKKHTEGKTRG